MVDRHTPYVGSEDLERGLPATPLWRFPVIVAICVASLLVFNSQGLVGWVERLPSNSKNAWIAGHAADWHELMQASGFARPMQIGRAWLQEHGGTR